MISTDANLLYNMILHCSNHKRASLPNIVAYHGMKWGAVHWLVCDYSQGSLMNCMIVNLQNYDFKNLENYDLILKE